MYRTFASALAAVALIAATPAFAQTVIDTTGRVMRVDPGTQVIILDNNQAFRVTPNTVLMVDNRPVMLNTLQPGQTVFIRSGEVVAVAPTAPSSAPPAASAPQGNTVVVNPAPAPSASPAGTQQTVYGRVDDVGSGEVKIKTDTDNFKVKLPREVAAQVRKGDTVRLDLTFQPTR